MSELQDNLRTLQRDLEDDERKVEDLTKKIRTDETGMSSASFYLSICVNLSTFLSSSVHILHHSIPPPPSLPLSLFICHSLVKHLFGLTRRYLFRNVHYTTDQDSSLCPCSMQHYKVLLSILSLNILEHSLRNVFFQSIEKTFDIWWNIGMTFILFSRSENEMFLSNYICF